ncbi:hypothetical protein [Arthrobacter sp. UYCo732]|uniref:hypothetical protein n=1 Tax=Arthrobacter sp. UYCo732 TaxID=3156336 RepID=UPI003399C6EC
MKTNEMVFNTKRMPEKWRRHFKIYRAKISIYLDTPDFGTPLMVDASEMMEFLPAGIDDPSFIEKTGPVRPGAESLWVEAEVPEGLPSRPNVRRIGAMVHRSKTRTSFMNDAWTGAEHEYWIEAYARDADGLSIRLEKDVRFRLDDAGFLAGLEFVSHQSIDFLVKLQGDAPSNLATAPYISTDQRTAFGIEVMNRVLFCLALMNCRNVSLRERGSRNGAGSAPSGDAFHEVVIDGNIRGSGATVGEAGDGTGRRHLARGHFKTFTDDAPLLGKHVGTYWWGWQVRGQESRGTVEKVYTLKSGSR